MSGIKAGVSAPAVEALLKDLEKDVLDELNQLTDQIVTALKAATPVDTGYAQSRWSREGVFRHLADKVFIENDAEYINILNAGHSQQAPKYFVEQVVFRLTGQVLK